MPKDQKRPKRNSQIVGFELTVFEPMDENVWINIFNRIAKNWAFQKEKSPTTLRPHFQCRFKTKEKIRVGTLLQTINELVLDFKGHLTPTFSGVHHAGTFNYVLKEDTRIDGPWHNRTNNTGMDGKQTIHDPPAPPPPRSTPEEQLVVERKEEIEEYRQVRDTPKRWQTKVLELCRTHTQDIIHAIIDNGGLKGKSSLVKYAIMQGLGMLCPCMEDITKIMGFICRAERRHAYFIDIPRSLGKQNKKRVEFWAGIEQLKTGMLYDWRHTSRVVIIPRPEIIMFSNNDIPNDALSAGRLRKWMIENDELVPYAKYPNPGKPLI